LKILQVNASYKPAFIYGGPTMSVSMLCEQLVKAGVSVSVFTTTANGKTELPAEPGQPVNADGVTVRYFKRITKDHSHLSPSLLFALWKDVKKFDLVHVHAWWNLVSVLSCVVALMRKVPVLLSPRGTLSPYSFGNKNIGPKWLIHHLLGKYLLNKSHIHTTTERESDAIKRLIHPRSITMLPNFIQLPGQKAIAVKATLTCLKLIFFSRIEEKKGLDILLNALALVSVPYHLTIAGSGEASYIQSLKIIAANNHTGNKISWIGFLNENKFELLQQHDLFVLPSYDENFGNAVIESLSVGTPVLISDQVGLADYVKKNSLGWICQVNETSISSTINEIATNHHAELMQIRKNAPGIIYEDFNEDKLAKKYIAMYDKLIKT
jgi:glycosyltransferase involved in cell wall biosynthesis